MSFERINFVNYPYAGEKKRKKKWAGGGQRGDREHLLVKEKKMRQRKSHSRDEGFNIPRISTTLVERTGKRASFKKKNVKPRVRKKWPLL